MSENRIKYRFGRNAFRDFLEGTKREWLLTNGIGGYANSTISGDSNRVFSAYLIASLHPPVDRVLVLAKTHEELRIERGAETFQETDAADILERMTAEGELPPEVSTGDTNEICRDFATQEYPGKKREGFRYLTSFSYDIVPEYCYQTDGITVKKSIAMEYGKNAAAVKYEIVNNSSRKAVLCVTPLFNYRPFGAVQEKSALKFQMELSQKDGLLCLTPEQAPEQKICFWCSEGEYYNRSLRPTSMATPDYVYEENELYYTDAVNGFTGVDCHYTPYEVRIALAPGEQKTVGMLCELITKEGLAQVGQNYTKFGQEEAKINFDNASQKKQPDFILNRENLGGMEREFSTNSCLNRVWKIFSDNIMRAKQLLAQAGMEDEFAGRLVLSADHFLAMRESTKKMTVLAGFPWFADWGRDTMIAFTGLTLATGRFEEAREVLESFAMYVSQGMLPNVFPNSAAEEPMYNTIDASLWYFYAVFEYLKYTTGLACYRGESAGNFIKQTADNKNNLSEEEVFIKEKIYPALVEIFHNYHNGTARFGIGMKEDGLIAGGSDLDQLTWMDVRVGKLVITPRHGKAVEINALWYNALRCMEVLTERFFGDKDAQCKNQSYPDAQEYKELAERVKKSFCSVFWNKEKGYLYDVIDAQGHADDSLRPNQIYAVSLPFTMLSKEKEESIVRTVYEKLYTPYGMRSLAKGEKGYRGKYIGRLIDRDTAYHMGTAWGYLSGAFLTAWLKVFGADSAKQMCLCFMDTMADGCLGGIAEIFDGDFACDSRGCYTQAWSVGEILRAWKEICESSTDHILP